MGGGRNLLVIQKNLNMEECLVGILQDKCRGVSRASVLLHSKLPQNFPCSPTLMITLDCLQNADKCVSALTGRQEETEPLWEEADIWHTQVVPANYGKMRECEGVRGSKETFQISPTAR